MSQNPYSQPQPPQGPPGPAQQPYPPAQAPPGYYPYAPQPQSAWPTVIGIISIVLAALALVCTPIGLVVNAVNPQSDRVYEFLPPWWHLWQIVSTLLGIAFAVVLLAAGVMLLKRRPAGRWLHLLYAFAAVAGMVINGLLTATSLRGLEGAPAEVRFGMLFGLLGGACVGLAYPVFLLIWLLRAKVAEEVRQWR